jgi:hypothetical protein
LRMGELMGQVFSRMSRIFMAGSLRGCPAVPQGRRAHAMRARTAAGKIKNPPVFELRGIKEPGKKLEKEPGSQVVTR